MAKDKTTITVERSKLEEARRLTGAPSASAAIDLALDWLIRSERLRRDIAAYKGTPPTEEELGLARITPPWTDLADETDWHALYPDE
jgi:hypothetical protein